MYLAIVKKFVKRFLIELTLLAFFLVGLVFISFMCGIGALFSYLTFEAIMEFPEQEGIGANMLQGFAVAFGIFEILSILASLIFTAEMFGRFFEVYLPHSWVMRHRRPAFCA